MFLVTWPMCYVLPGVFIAAPLWYVFGRGRVVANVWDRLIFLLPGVAWLGGMLLKGDTGYLNMLIEPLLLLPLVPVYFSLRLYTGRTASPSAALRTSRGVVGAACLVAFSVGAMLPAR